MKRILSDREMALCYVLNEEFGRSQKKIADFMDISQSSVSNAIREFKHRMRVESLERELDDARRQLELNGLKQLPPRGTDFDVLY